MVLRGGTAEKKGPQDEKSAMDGRGADHPGGPKKKRGEAKDKF